jgi:hypothetical protein
MNFKTFIIDYIRRKSNILMTTVLIEHYYLNLDITQEIIDSLPSIFGDKIITMAHLKRCFTTMINMICEFYKVKTGIWLTTDYYRLNNKWVFCFVYDLWEKIEQNKLYSFNLFRECESWDDLFSLIEKNPIQFKTIIYSIKEFSLMCDWILKKNLTMERECYVIIKCLKKWVNTLEFKSLESSAYHLNNENINIFFSNLS